MELVREARVVIGEKARHSRLLPSRSRSWKDITLWAVYETYVIVELPFCGLHKTLTLKRKRLSWSRGGHLPSHHRGLCHVIHVAEDEVGPGLVARTGTLSADASLTRGLRLVTLHSSLAALPTATAWLTVKRHWIEMLVSPLYSILCI